VEIFFADDSIQRVCARESMGPLISVGGVLIEEAQLRPLSAAMDAIAARFGVPEKEEFKWSPRKGSWIYDYLHDGNREDCYPARRNRIKQHSSAALTTFLNASA
jgi:hypothetical protein